MFEYIDSFQKTPHGAIILGAIGSIVAVIILKIISSISRKWIPEFLANWRSLETFHKRAVTTQQRTDTLFLLILYSSFAIICLVIVSVCAIRVTIYEMVIDYEGYKLIVNYSGIFLGLYGFFRALGGVTALVESVFAKKGIDFMGKESANKANAADAENRRG